MFISDFISGRGIIIYGVEKLCITKIELEIDFKEFILCKIKLSKSENLILGCIYHSPNSTEENSANLFNVMKAVCNIKPSHLLIMGNFNIKEINWELVTSETSENHISSKFIVCVRDCFLFQHVLEPTRFRSGNAPSILDLIFTNEEYMISDLSFLPGLGKSDHMVLNFNFKCHMEVSSTSFKKYNFFKGNYTAIESELNSENLCQNLQGLNLMESWDCLTDKLTRIIDNIPESKAPLDPTKRRPYVNSTCLNSI